MPVRELPGGLCPIDNFGLSLRNQLPAANIQLYKLLNFFSPKYSKFTLQIHRFNIRNSKFACLSGEVNIRNSSIMLKKILFLIGILQFTACAELQQIAGDVMQQPLTAEEVGRGLKEALNFGISEGVQKLSARDGYFKSPYKILLPAEAQKVADKLKTIPGFSEVENEILQRLNRAAEDAATKAKPIFVDAIKQMTFQDAFDILTGADNAATGYLRQSTYRKLYEAFNPVIIRSLDKVKARTYWRDAVNAYNNIPLVKKMNPSLDDYVTTQALSGLFSMVEVKEKKIRDDVSQRTTDLLRRVFARQDG
jgi:hypothetical protein